MPTTALQVIVGGASIVSAVGVLLVLVRLYRPTVRRSRDAAIRTGRFVRRNWTEILVTISTVATVVGTIAAVVPLFR